MTTFVDPLDLENGNRGAVAMDWSCPLPTGTSANRVVLAHGDGGRLARQLLRERILPHLGVMEVDEFADAARLSIGPAEFAFSTDAFIVTPLFFPGGDIGALAVHGSANDLFVLGARPRWISLALILEEGLAMNDLDRVLASVSAAAKEIDVSIVTGDTKVAPRGSVDQMFVTTAGIGELVAPIPAGPSHLSPGDVVIVTGGIGRHGTAILCSREGIAFEPPPKSDLASLGPAAMAMREAGVRIRAMRDATRGGVAAVLHEWAGSCGRTILIREREIPVTSDVRGVCELLGLDPLFLACEGAMLVAVEAGDAVRAVEALHRTTVGRDAAVIGVVEGRGVAPVILEGIVGQHRPLEEPVMPSMPRIC